MKKCDNGREGDAVDEMGNMNGIKRSVGDTGRKSRNRSILWLHSQGKQYRWPVSVRCVV